MAVSSAAVTTGTAAVALNRTETDVNTGQTLYVYNTSGATIWLGGSNVTSATGVALAAAATSDDYDLRPGDVLYAVGTAAGTVVVLALHA